MGPDKGGKTKKPSNAYHQPHSPWPGSCLEKSTRLGPGPCNGRNDFLGSGFNKERPLEGFLGAMIVVVISFLAWYVASLILVGNDRAVFQENQSYNFTVLYLRIGLSRVLENIKLIRNSGFFIPIILSCLYAIIGIFKNKGMIDQARALLFALAGFGLFSSIIISLPWARYIYTGIVLTIPVLSALVNDCIIWLKSHNHTLLWYGLSICLIVFMGFIALKLFTDTNLIIQTKNDDVQKFAELVDRTVPTGSEVFNWEWDVEFYSRSEFVHPDFKLFSALVDQTYNKVDSPILHNTYIPVGAHYLIVGPFASQSGMFAEEGNQRAINPLGQVGDYSLYYMK